MSVGFVSSDPLDNLTNLYQRPIFIQADRAPTINDVYPAETTWGDNVQPIQNLYVTPGKGIWILQGSSTSPLATINHVAAVANNIDLIDQGNAGAITVTPGGVGTGQVGLGVRVDGTTIIINGADQLSAGPSISNPIQEVNVQTGTSPVVPTGSPGAITINGAVVGAGVNPVRTDGTGPNTFAIEIQTSQALAAADATKIGLSNFDSAFFKVDPTGFVQLLNSFNLSTTTTDATPDVSMTIPLTDGHVYTFDISVAARARSGVGTPLGAGYTLVGAIRMDGGASTTLPNQALDAFEENSTMSGLKVVLTDDGVGNAIIKVTGLALYTIDWVAKVSYVVAP